MKIILAGILLINFIVFSECEEPDGMKADDWADAAIEDLMKEAKEVKDAAKAMNGPATCEAPTINDKNKPCGGFEYITCDDVVGDNVECCYDMDNFMALFGICTPGVRLEGGLCCNV